MSIQSGLTAKLRIKRATSYAESLRSYAIVVDGEKIGKIRMNETKEFAMTPGNHEIYVKVNFMRSNLVTTNLSSCETLELECGPVNTGWRLPLSFIWWFIRPHKYFWLRIVENCDNS